VAFRSVAVILAAHHTTPATAVRLGVLIKLIARRSVQVRFHFETERPSPAAECIDNTIDADMHVSVAISGVVLTI